MEPILTFKGPYRFLSSMFITPIIFEDKEYRSVEHAYQASKTINEDERKYIRELQCPVWAKRAGKRVTIRQNWNKIKIPIMTEFIWQKFNKTDLKEKLINTNPRDIFHENWWGDQFWGTCNLIGENHFGKILMNKRSQLISEDKFYE